MANFQIHPHFGYLNSDIRLINGSESPIVVQDKMDGKDYSIPAMSNITVKLKAGEHSFCVAGIDNIVETIIVEDAIKLGGSREKKSYIFEDTPWALMVMLDRTYFYNRETKEQYIEHGLAPKKIKFISNNYLLFISDTDNSIFSLDNLAVIETIGDSSFLFSNSQYAVFSIPTGILLYSIKGDDDRRITKYDCDDFSIDDSENIIYYHEIGKRDVAILKIDSQNLEGSQYKLPEAFRCFVGAHSVVTGNNPQSLTLTNLNSGKSDTLYDGIAPVTSINAKIIWSNNALDSITHNDIKNTFTSYVEISVHEKGERWFYIVRKVNVLKNCGVVSEKNDYTLFTTNTKYATGERVPHLQSEKPLTIIKGEKFDGIMCDGGKTVLISETLCKDFTGEPVVSPNGYMLIATNDNSRLIDPLDLSFKHSTAGNVTKETFRKTGLIKIESSFELGDVKILYPYRDIENNRVYANTAHEDIGKEGFFRLFGGVGDFIHSTKGSVKPMPCVKDRLIAISEECNFAIIRNEDGIVINEYIPAEKKWSSSPLGNMEIDDSFYCKAVFCSDGENIIYQKQGKEYFLREIGSDVESEFQLQGSIIKRNINGYIPYLEFDTHRKPVYVDPVSLTRIEEAAAGQFTYQSIDGKITHIAHNVVKYYSYEKKQYVPLEEYESYVSKYDYEFEGTKKTGPSYENAKYNREKYYNRNKEWLDELIHRKFCFFARLTGGLKPFLDCTSICDDILFRKDYFIRENMNGEDIDILLPQKLNFLNYVSYSYDNRYIIIAGRFPLNSTYKGLAMVYDVNERKIVYRSTSTMAVWLGVFSKQGILAYYDSAPCSFLSDNIANKESYDEIKGRSFLTFSPSGKFIALSRQGYIPYVSGNPHWGHQPSRDVYIVRSDDPHNEIAHYCDHGEQIEGTGGWDRTNNSVASATFSKDDRKLMTVSKDGVIVIRNLHLQ